MQDLVSDETTTTVVEENAEIDIAEEAVESAAEDDALLGASQAVTVVAVADSAARQTSEERSLLEWLTVERMLFGLCILIGGALRFFGLAAQPLSSMEAASAWASWLSANGFDASNSAAGLLAATAPATSPLLYALNAILFWLGGGNDVLARFLPALFGTGMVVLAWYLRPQIGRWPALALALLLAIDPWLVAYSRLVDGTILSAFFGLLGVIGLLHLGGSSVSDVEDDSSTLRGWMPLTAVSIGLLLVSGVQAWSFVPVLLLCFWICCGGDFTRLARHDSASDDDAATDRAGGSTWWGLIAAAALLGATGWLAFPQGLSYLSTSLSGWLSQFGFGETDYSLGWLRLRLLVDQPLLLIFGTAGLFTLWRSREWLPKGWPRFLLLWTAWGAILALLPGRMPTSLLLLEVPLLFAAAHVIGSLPKAERSQSWGESILFIGMLAALVVSAWFMLTIVVHDSQFRFEQARIAVLPIVAIVASLIFFVFWASRQRAFGLASGFFAGLLALMALSSSVQLSHRVDATAPDAFFDEYTSTDVRALAENVGSLSSQRIGDPIQASVHVALNGGPDPLLGWYLRKMQNLRWGAATPTGDDANPAAMPFLISYQHADAASVDGLATDSSAADADARAPEGYLGSEYGLRFEWMPNELPSYTPPEEAPADDSFVARINARWGAELRPLLRWILYREVNPPPSSKRVVLWISVVEN